MSDNYKKSLIDEIHFEVFTNSLSKRHQLVVDELLNEMNDNFNLMKHFRYWDYAKSESSCLFEFEWEYFNFYASVEFHDNAGGKEGDDNDGEVDWFLKNRHTKETAGGHVKNAIHFPNDFFLESVGRFSKDISK